MYSVKKTKKNENKNTYTRVQFPCHVFTVTIWASIYYLIDNYCKSSALEYVYFEYNMYSNDPSQSTKYIHISLLSQRP